MISRQIERLPAGTHGLLRSPANPSQHPLLRRHLEKERGRAFIWEELVTVAGLEPGFVDYLRLCYGNITEEEMDKAKDKTSVLHCLLSAWGSRGGAQGPVAWLPGLAGFERDSM